jgi:hypothetical protein
LAATATTGAAKIWQLPALRLTDAADTKAEASRK